jgi:L-threonylcarbamoyladenylate synthase
MVEAEFDNFRKFISENDGEEVYSLIYDSDEKDFPYKHMTYGETPLEQAHWIFQRLRELDVIGAETVYVRAPLKTGVGLAVYNRLIRAAGFEVIRI